MNEKHTGLFSHLLRLLSKEGAISVLKKLKNGRKRFGDLYHEFNSPASLTRRVRELENLGLIKREADYNPNERGVFYYTITERGKRILELHTQWERAVRKTFDENSKAHQ